MGSGCCDHRACLILYARWRGPALRDRGEVRDSRARLHGVDRAGKGQGRRKGGYHPNRSAGHDDLPTRGGRVEGRASTRRPHNHGTASGIGDPGVALPSESELLRTPSTRSSQNPLSTRLVNRPSLVAATCPSARGSHEGGSLPYHQDHSSEAERWPKRQGEADPESEFDRKEDDREHRSGAPTTPQKPSRHDLQPTDAQERDEQRNGGSYADSLKWPPTVRRKPEERPDLTGPREIPDRVGARQTETESENDAEDRGEPHHRLGCGVRSTRSYGSNSFRRVGCS